jgi:hypothetical protein
MLEIATTVAVSALFLACMVCAGYIIFFPLVGTVLGGLQILRIYALRRSVATELGRSLDPFILDAEIGLTMADGGERTKKEQDDTAGKEP